LIDRKKVIARKIIYFEIWATCFTSLPSPYWRISTTIRSRRITKLCKWSEGNLAQKYVFWNQYFKYAYFGFLDTLL